MKKYFSYSPLPFRYFLISGLIFSVLLIVKSYLEVEDSDLTFYGSLNHSVLTFWKYVLWPFFIPGINYFVIKVKSKTSRSANIGFLLLSVVLAAALHAVISNIFYYLTLWQLVGSEMLDIIIPEFKAYFIWIFLSRLIDVGVILGIISTINFYRNYTDNIIQITKLRTELREAELATLRNQLKPHFLFNTLNTISSLIDQNPEKAQKVLSKIAHLLRTNLDQQKKEKITLREELDVVKDYLEIETERFNDRFKVEYSIDEEALEKKIPNLILQPLVENSIKHGVNQTLKMITLEVKAALRSNRLNITIKDNGVGADPEKGLSETTGIGLKNIKARLERLYEGNASILVNTKEKEFFEVFLTFPIEN